MKLASAHGAAPSFSFLRNVALTPSETNSTALIAVALVTLTVSLIAPAIGIPLAQIGFPLLAIWILLRKTTDRFAPTTVFPAVYLLWYWLGNLPILIVDRAAVLPGSAADRVWLYSLLGFIAYLCGTLLIRDEGLNPGSLRGAFGSWQGESLLILVVVLMAGIFLAWASITVSEGIPIFKGEVDTFRLEVSARHHLAYQVLIAFSSLMLPLAFLYLWTSKAPKFRKTLYAFCGFIVFIFVSLGSRGLLLPSVLTVFALRHYLRKPWRVRYILLAGVIILPLLSISGYYRSLQHFGPSYALDLLDMGLPLQFQPFSNIYLYIRAPIETFRTLLSVIPDATPFQHGGISFGFLEQILPGRHPSSDLFFKQILGHPEDGFGEPASILGSFYADFGAAGIFAGMFLTGLLTKFVYVHMFRGSLGWVLAYCFLWQKLIGSLYGSLFTYVTELLVPLVWIIAVWILTKGTIPYRDTPNLETDNL